MIEDVKRDGKWTREARRCECLKAWLREQQAPRPTALQKERRDLA